MTPVDIPTLMKVSASARPGNFQKGNTHGAKSEAKYFEKYTWALSEAVPTTDKEKIQVMTQLDTLGKALRKLQATDTRHHRGAELREILRGKSRAYA